MSPEETEALIHMLINRIEHLEDELKRTKADNAELFEKVNNLLSDREGLANEISNRYEEIKQLVSAMMDICKIIKKELPDNNKLYLELYKMGLLDIDDED